MHDFAGNVCHLQISKVLFWPSSHRQNTLQSGYPENVLCAIVVQTLVPKVFLNICCGIDFQMHFFIELCFDKPALYCQCHLLGSQKMTRIVFIDETFILHNLPFYLSDQTLVWLFLHEC